MADSDLPVQLSAEAPHRLRRAEDREEQEIRQRCLEHWIQAIAVVSPRQALFGALDLYREELGAMAIRRLGLRGTR